MQKCKEHDTKQIPVPAFYDRTSALNIREHWERHLKQPCELHDRLPYLRTRQLYWPINIDIKTEEKYLERLNEGKTYELPYQSKPYKRTKHTTTSSTVVLPSLDLVLGELDETKGSSPEQLRRDETCYIC